MTANQLEYLKLQESARHNRVAEKETERANMRSEAQREAALNQDVREFDETAGLRKAQTFAAKTKGVRDGMGILNDAARTFVELNDEISISLDDVLRF